MTRLRQHRAPFNLLGLLTSFCTIYNYYICLLVSVSPIGTAKVIYFTLSDQAITSALRLAEKSDWSVTCFLILPLLS